ncbi:uncharacterized protein [Symphalangus syndactylus]|uniref:uncharacterized protein isoform X2 n=1 Tax=Symphalangus syndactylus TaxID=9590 RepID=UPI003005A9A2
MTLKTCCRSSDPSKESAEFWEILFLLLRLQVTLPSPVFPSQAPSREETPAVVDVASPSVHETPGPRAGSGGSPGLPAGVSQLLRMSQGTRMAAWLLQVERVSLGPELAEVLQQEGDAGHLAPYREPRARTG